MARIDLIAGARPNFVKIAAIVHALHSQDASGTHIDYRLVHTGQHYDPKLSQIFFDQLDIPKPSVNLNVGSGSQAEQTAAIMVAYEKLLAADRSDMCLVVGDVTSTMATAITAQKLHVPVSHVEAGIRSGDWSMPEEINRLLTDAISNWHFTTTQLATDQLINSGADPGNVYFVGNTMVDTLLANMSRLRQPEYWDELQLTPSKYLVLTLHRPSNVDDSDKLNRMLATVSKLAKGLKIVFPVHPRTKLFVQEIPDLPENLLLVEPQPYLEFNYLVKHALAVITDSGGITEEATVMNVPCMTLRDNTERPETVVQGTNRLLGADGAGLSQALTDLHNGKWKTGVVPDKWDGKAGERIVRILQFCL